MYDALQRPNRIRKPSYDPERIQVEPDVRWMDSVITPFIRTAAGVYDLANRRWYELCLERVVTDEAWLASEVQRYLASAPKQLFNSISIADNGEVTYTFKDDVSRPIYDMAPYDGSMNKTTLNLISKRKYLSGHVDTCEWNGQKVTYKCLEFTFDVEAIFREIRTREKLDSDFTGVAPILAVVIDPDTRFVDGIILPLYDTDLECFAKDPHARLRVSDLHRLVHTVTRLRLLGILHGDICERNVVLNVTCGHTSEDIALLDFGEVAPSYQGDLEMTALLLEWCVDSFTWTEREKKAVVTAAAKIREGDCENALDLLSSNC